MLLTRLFITVNQHLISLPCSVKYAALGVSYLIIAHFYLFVIKKSPNSKSIFWQTAAYFSCATVGYIILKKYCPNAYEPIFLNIHMQRAATLLFIPLLNTFRYFIAAASLVIVLDLCLFFLLPQKKELKHGPIFVPTTTHTDSGITIGTFDQNVLPAHIRDFIPASKKHLVIPYSRLSRGITILGEMGSGKSRLMYAIHNGIRARYPNMPILIHDPKGEWLRTFYDPDNDLIFAPFDNRSCGWSILEDFKRYPQLKYSLISTSIESHHSGNYDRFWSDTAITLLKDVFDESNLTIAKKSLMMRRDSKMGDRTFQSILATSLIAFRDIATIELMALSSKYPKSIKDFLSHSGRIFLLNNPCCASEQHGALTLLLSAFLLHSLSLPDVNDDKLQATVFIDEALTFHLPADIERVVYSQSRSKGLCLIASAQRLPEVHYSERGGWSNGATHIFGMRVSDLATRSSLSQRLGSIMYDEEQHSVSRGRDTTKTSSEIQRHHATLAPEDFGTLKNRQFILFHETGVAPGTVVENTEKQRNEILPIEYLDRKDVVEFMRGL